MKYNLQKGFEWVKAITQGPNKPLRNWWRMKVLSFDAVSEFYLEKYFFFSFIYCKSIWNLIDCNIYQFESGKTFNCILSFMFLKKYLIIWNVDIVRLTDFLRFILLLVISIPIFGGSFQGSIKFYLPFQLSVFFFIFIFRISCCFTWHIFEELSVNKFYLLSKWQT